LQNLLPRTFAGSVLEPEFQKIREEGFCFADKEKIQKRCQWFRIQEHRNAAGGYVRRRGTALFAQRWNPPQVDHLHSIVEIILKGDREDEQMEILQRPLRLDAQQPAGLLPEKWQVFGFGIENPFADNVFMSIQGFINRLEAQVGHANRIAVGKGQGNTELSAPILINRSLFLSQPSLLPLLQFPQHVWIKD